jgi:hypothetical protein
MGMRPDDIHPLLHRRPFQPFRIVLSDGAAFEVRHPELCMIGRATLIVGIPSRRHRWPTFDRAITIALLHIVAVELLLADSPAG